MDHQFVQKLEETLSQVLSSDSATIKAATAQLTKYYEISDALPALFYIIQNNQNPHLKKLAAIEARKAVNNHWEKRDASSKASLNESMLTFVFIESDRAIRHQVARIITSIASYELGAGSWNSSLQILVAAATDDSNVVAKETATFILLSLLEAEIPELGEHIDSFLQLFHKTVQDASSQEIRINSVLALASAAAISETYIDEKPQLAGAFRQSIPAMVQVLKEVIESGDSDISKQVFNSFNDLLLLDAKLLGDNLIELVKFMIEISVNTQIDEEIRNFAIQFLSSASTFRRNKISSKKLGKDITLAALRITSEEIDVEAELEKDDDDNENEENEPSTLALRLITIAASELPPSQVVSTIFEQLGGLLGSANKFERRAGLLSIGAACSGAPDFYTTHISKVVAAVVAGLKDPELIVRISALRSLASLTSELQEYLSEQYEVLLPLIIEIIDSATNANVYKYACVSLDTLIEFMSIEAVGKYLEPLMNKLFHMLHVTEASKLRSIIVSAIGSAAFAAGTGFIPYFSKSIEILEPFIQTSASVEGMSEDEIELRALTFENISTMARAVGSESFSQYAKPLIDAAYVGIKSDAARLREAGYAFISNMAKVYRKDFAPFLENIVPEIYKTLEQDEFNMNIPEGDDDQFDEEDLNENFQVHTGVTIEKEIAAIALAELALGTQELFTPYIEQSVNILAEQANESYGMRETALTSLWKVVEAIVSVSVEPKKYPKGVPAGSYVDANVLQLIQLARNLTIDILGQEFEITMVASILDVLSELLKKFGPIILIDNGDSTSLETVCAGLMELLNGQHPCQTLDDDEIQDDEDADASETEALLLESALEVLVNLSLALGADFNKIFESFKSVIAANVTSKSKNKRVFAIGALAEIALGLKEANPYTDELLQLFIQKLESDKSLEVRGNAAYGVGILVFYSNNNYSSLYPNIFNSLSKLLSKVQKQESQVDEDDEETKDVIHRSYANASGCVARLVLKQQDVVPVNEVLPVLIAHLPLQAAFEENTPIFQLFSRLYQSGDDSIVQFTPKIIEIFSHAFLQEAEREKLEKESTLGREENIDRLRQFQTAELKAETVELLKFLESKYAGSVSQDQFLASVIA